MYIDKVIIVQNETEIANCKLQFDQYGTEARDKIY
jgi:hypothetical protein